MGGVDREICIETSYANTKNSFFFCPISTCYDDLYQTPPTSFIENAEMEDKIRTLLHAFHINDHPQFYLTFLNNGQVDNQESPNGRQSPLLYSKV